MESGRVAEFRKFTSHVGDERRSGQVGEEKVPCKGGKS